MTTTTTPETWAEARARIGLRLVGQYLLATLSIEREDRKRRAGNFGGIVRAVGVGRAPNRGELLWIEIQRPGKPDGAGLPALGKTRSARCRGPKFRTYPDEWRGLSRYGRTVPVLEYLSR